jgi:lysophospholipase L1-like esterase
MKNAFFNIGLLLISILGCFFAAELGLRYFAPQNVIGLWRVTASNGYYLNRSSGTARHEKCDISASYEFFPPHLRGMPSEAGGRRILALGDSFTFGWLLHEENAYVSILQGLADKEFGPAEFAFLNAGTPGFGTAHYLRYVEDFGPEIQPDIALVFLNTDDIGRSVGAGLYELRDNEAKTVEVGNQPTTRDMIKSFINSIPVYHWLLDNSHLVQALRTLALTGGFRIACQGNDVISPEDPIPIPQSSDVKVDVELSRELGRALFRRLRDWCAENNVDLLVVTTGWFAFGDKDPSEPTNSFLESAQEFFDSEGIRYFDPTSILEAQKNKAHTFIWPGDGHPNEKGARLIANSVWGWLRLELARFAETPNCGDPARKALNGVDCSSFLPSPRAKANRPRAEGRKWGRRGARIGRKHLENGNSGPGLSSPLTKSALDVRGLV